MTTNDGIERIWRDMDMSVIELLVLKQLPTGIWPLVGFREWQKEEI
mgnify:CR=1 FL=1